MGKPDQPRLTPLDDFPASTKKETADTSLSNQVLQEKTQQESRKATTLSNASRARHDAAGNTIQNAK